MYWPVKAGSLVQCIGGRSVSGTSGRSSAISCRSPHPAKTTLQGTHTKTTLQQGTHLVIHRHYIQSNPSLHSVHSPMQFHFRGQRCRVQVRAAKCCSGYSQRHKYARDILLWTNIHPRYSPSCTNIHSGYSAAKICIQSNGLRPLVMLQLIYIYICTIVQSAVEHYIIPCR